MTEGFTARPRKPADPHASHDLANTRDAVERLLRTAQRVAGFNEDDVADRDTDAAMIAEAFVVRVDTLISRLPEGVSALLDPRDVRGLRDTRNYVAHDYLAGDPAILLEAVTLRIPALLRDVAVLIDTEQ